MTQAPLEGTLWQHLKTKHIYIILHNGIIEANMMRAVIYRRLNNDDDPTVWIRPTTEFMDGRFEYTEAV